MDTLSYLDDYAAILSCPRCSGDLQRDGEQVLCSACPHRFAIEDNIPLLFWRNEWASDKPDVTDRMKAFYEESPFPNYDEFDDVSSLMQKARRGVFANLLNEQVPFGARVIECGCGTGQLSTFLSVAQRTVFGVDMCLNSLRLGQQFKERNGLGRVHFMQMNLFAPTFKPESFDLVISNGVLHHTGDPFLAFQTISTLVKPGGHILIGLYHRYGRLFTDFRRVVFRVTRDKMKFLDPRLLNERIARKKRDAWFADQYKNPHESKHTIGEVLGWFEQTDFDFVKSIPKSVPGSQFTAGEQLFAPERPGNALERLAVELPQMFTATEEGGFFIMIGRKRPNTVTPQALIQMSHAAPV